MSQENTQELQKFVTQLLQDDKGSYTPSDIVKLRNATTVAQVKSVMEGALQRTFDKINEILRKEI